MIVFRNPGLIDMDAVRTLGVSVKESENPIGYFGTGLKFAVATILRNGGSVDIVRGGERFMLRNVATTIRGQSFDIVTLNGEQLGFTTMLGRNWEPWMAFREFACNAIDENGRYSDAPTPPCGADETVIEVTGGGIEAAYAGRGEVILESKPVEVGVFVARHPGASPHVYYRGVRVATFPKPFRYTYNVSREVTLTEDRTARYDFELNIPIAQFLASSDRADFIEESLLAGSAYMEDSLSFPSHFHLSLVFQEVLEKLRKSAVVFNSSASKLARERALGSMGPDEGVALNAVESKQLAKAKSILMSAGFEIERFPIVIVEDLGDGILGRAAEDKIFLSRKPFLKGTREVAATLLEEFLHLVTGYGDCTREFQNHLFDRLLCQIETTVGEAF